ncbi:MAG: cysteine desulfurase family protein [Candidatus Nanoarchaeia archaeon]|nr:cysteine desulfurase family protein [Candidatus Nanoarchaeia archaeon]MDD5741621.1 cysteine desulfurase family protein [Candidatus Nanoarchaeia archaeon]
MRNIYLDNAATTKVDEKVVREMLPYFTEKYGNASSQHLVGQEAKRALQESRHVIAKSINAKDDEIIFTSGGTESNNLALKGLFFANKEAGTEKNHIITTKIEHDCVLNSCKWLEKQGAKITCIDVNSEGFVNINQLKQSITPNTLVVSIIHGNNEIGTIQDIEEIGKICREKGVYFHIDACQSYTKTPINVKKQNLDLVTLNSHKIHGPKGVGALYIREGIKIIPLAHGGGHEKALRNGTENVSGIVGFAKSVNLASSGDIKHMTKLRDYLIEEILKIPNTKLNGAKGDKRLCNNINISFNNIEGEAIGGYLDSYGICSSTGSACSSHTLETSHVLKAIGLSNLQANTTLRLSLSKYTTKEEIDYTLEILKKVVEKLRRMSPIK